VSCAHRVQRHFAPLCLISCLALVVIVSRSRCSTFLVLGFMSMFVLVIVIAYLAVWVPLTATRPVLDLSTYSPMAGPIGAIAGVATFVLSGHEHSRVRGDACHSCGGGSVRTTLT
jgi:hypothetical protein